MEAAVRVGMPLDEFIRLYDTEGPFELLHGERKRKMPSVAGHTETIRIANRSLDNFTQIHHISEVFSEATFILPDAYDSNWVEGSRTPDLFFIAAERFAAYKAATPDWKNRPYAVVPDLVVEVVSPNDTYSDIDAKVDLYLSDGVRVIWVLDPQRRKVTIHTPDDECPRSLTGDAILDGGDLLPGFQIKLTDLFA